MRKRRDSPGGSEEENDGKRGKEGGWVEGRGKRRDSSEGKGT